LSISNEDNEYFLDISIPHDLDITMRKYFDNESLKNLIVLSILLSKGLEITDPRVKVLFCYQSILAMEQFKTNNQKNDKALKLIDVVCI